MSLTKKNREVLREGEAQSATPAHIKKAKRELLDLWAEDPPTNWRPRISDVELQALIRDLIVFHRVADIIVHRKAGEPIHLDIRHPRGVHGWDTMYKRLHEQMSERSGFTYMVGPVSRKEEKHMRDLSHRTCAVTPAPYPGTYREGRDSLHATGLLWTYLDPNRVKVNQARTYDPEALAVSGPYAGDMVVMNWGGGRLTTGAFPQCADCMYAGTHVVPKFYESSAPLWWFHVGAYCVRHCPTPKEIGYAAHPLRWSGVDLVFPAWEDLLSPEKKNHGYAAKP